MSLHTDFTFFEFFTAGSRHRNENKETPQT